MRAIDADAFKEYITDACEDMKHLFNDGGAVAKLITESFCKDIDEQPTIQPDIVRCEECLYRKICSWEKQGAKFCSFAERREVTT